MCRICSLQDNYKVPFVFSFLHHTCALRVHSHELWQKAVQNRKWQRQNDAQRYAIGLNVSELKICSRFWIAFEWQSHKNTKLRKQTIQPCGIRAVRAVSFSVCATKVQMTRVSARKLYTRRWDVEYAPLNRINNWRCRTNILKIVTNDSLQWNCQLFGKNWTRTTKDRRGCVSIFACVWMWVCVFEY